MNTEVALLKFRLRLWQIKAWLVARFCHPMTDREKDSLRIKLRWMK